MKEMFVQYLSEPTSENFIELRKLLLETEGFNPYSTEIEDNNLLLESDDHENILKLFTEILWPNHLLSPLAHFYMAHASHKLGRMEDFEFEYLVYQRLLDGIKNTGEGTKEKPFYVTRVSDEYDILREKKINCVSQALTSVGEREFDVVSTDNNIDIWFDVTEIRNILNNRLFQS